MYFKLSVKNIKKSFKDYTLYFLTLTFAVCIFYIFNSIEAQKAMMSISQSTLDVMKSITNLMSVVSVFVSFILGFLIVYANNFLIRRRKKELGIYMTLGMEKGKIAKLLVAETFIIGILSLGSGLLSGIFLSQGLSVVTAKLFEADLTGYQFIFSPEAFFKTIIYFGIMFLVVMILSTISISKYKLIDLINADRKNQEQKLKNPVITIALFVLSIAFLWKAYSMVLESGITYFDNRLLMEVLLGITGTFMFFASLSGFFLKLLQSRKKLYFKHLNMFVLRQINSKINTTFISISLICLMLFGTIGILSTGLAMNNALNSSFTNAAPYDASFFINDNKSLPELIQKYNIDINNYTDNYIEFSLYKNTKAGLTKGMVLGNLKEKSKEVDNFRETPMYMIKVSDYNKLMKLKGKKELTLPDNNIAVYSDYAPTIIELNDALESFLNNEKGIEISGKKYGVYNELLTEGLITSTSNGIIIALVVPDKLADTGNPIQTILSFNCKGNRESTLEKLESDITRTIEKSKDRKEETKIFGETKNMVKSKAVGSKAIISFVCIYLGIVFLISSTAILALQQLSEATDNRRRYDILKKIGADDKLINSALFKQIAIYFLLPLALAIVHSIVGIKVTNDAIKEAGGINALSNTIITAVLITIVYGSYFLATYFSSKRIILRSKI